MSISGILRPLPGERVVAIAPEDAAEAATTWLRRPNPYPGRALTAPTLEARSEWAAGRIAQRDHAVRRRIVGLAGSERLAHAVQQRGRRGELRGIEVAHREVADVRALGLHRADLGGDAQDLGADHAAREIGQRSVHSRRIAELAAEVHGRHVGPILPHAGRGEAAGVTRPSTPPPRPARP